MPHADRLAPSTPDCIALFTDDPQSGCWRRRGGSASPAAPSRPGSTGSQARGVVSSWAPQLDPAALGYPVTAFCTLEIRQGRRPRPRRRRTWRRSPRCSRRTRSPASGDLLVRIVARDNADLQRVIDEIVDDPHVTRANTRLPIAASAERIGTRRHRAAAVAAGQTSRRR